jgi:hypothetical protein
MRELSTRSVLCRKLSKAELFSSFHYRLKEKREKCGSDSLSSRVANMSAFVVFIDGQQKRRGSLNPRSKVNLTIGKVMAKKYEDT